MKRFGFICLLIWGLGMVTNPDNIAYFKVGGFVGVFLGCLLIAIGLGGLIKSRQG